MPGRWRTFRRAGFVAGLGGVACLAAIATMLTGRLVAPAAAADAARARACTSTPSVCAVEPTVRRFVTTAVERRNPAAAFALAAPELRQGMTRAQWAKGDIPVVPFRDVAWPASHLRFSDASGGVRYFVLHLRSNRRAVEANFWIGLRKAAGHWLVAYFAPAGTVGAPTSS